MAEQTDDRPAWNLSAAQWDAVLARIRASSDALEDGAYVRAVPDPETGRLEAAFFATALNKPAGWRYPFLEEIPDSGEPGALVGYARHDPSTGFVHFEVALLAAAQALRADYESGVADLDYLAYEQAVERAVRGTPADERWLSQEFARLVTLATL